MCTHNQCFRLETRKKKKKKKKKKKRRREERVSFGDAVWDAVDPTCDDVLLGFQGHQENAICVVLPAYQPALPGYFRLKHVMSCDTLLF